MDLVTIVIGVALVEYVFFAIMVGKARVQSGIKAPATTGNDVFERHYRVQMNTLELLVAFIPGMVMFARAYGSEIAAGLGIVFIIGRFIYYKSYVADPDKRSMGFGLSFLPTVILVIGGIIGAVMNMVNSPM